jgi:hypothetical protein
MKLRDGKGKSLSEVRMTLTVDEAREELQALSRELEAGLRRVGRHSVSDAGEVEFVFSESGCGFALKPAP